MDNTKLLAVARNLHALADSLLALSEEQQTTQDEAKASEQQTVSLEEIRSVLADKSRQNLTAKVRELLGRYGVKKLSEVDPARYPELLTEAKELRDE